MTTDTNLSSDATAAVARAAAPRSGAPTADRWLRRARALLGKNTVWLLLLDGLLIGVFYFASRNGAFLNPANIESILMALSQVLLLVVAQTMLLSAGQIDLSQGANVVFSSVIAGLALRGVSSSADPGGLVTVPFAIVVAAVAGGFVGMMCGLLVGLVRINSFVATLGVLGIVLGISQVFTNGDNLSDLPTSIQSQFGILRVLDIPCPTLLAALIVCLMWLQFSRGRFGLYSVAIGSSEKAAVRNGVPRARHLILLYTVCGAMSGIAGAFDLARFTTTDVGGHTNDALASISGAVIGGTSLFGGRAAFLGSILGGLLGLILQSGLVILDFPPFYQTIVVGVILIVAVALDQPNRAGGR